MRDKLMGKDNRAFAAGPMGHGFRLLIRLISSEVRIVERVFRDKAAKRLGGGLKDLPLCERCGRPVRVSSDDFAREEILCANCAQEARVSEFDDHEAGTFWS